jgi:hypothetical protein
MPGILLHVRGVVTQVLRVTVVSLVVPVMSSVPAPVFGWGQGSGCSETIAAARAQAEAFDLAGALELVRSDGECEEGQGIAEYLEGLLGAREAVKQGGTVESLRDVRSAANALSRRAEGGDRRWEVASLAMRATAAAAQDERDEMALYLAEATRIEALLLNAQYPGAPFVTAHELAGDLWLQVDRFDDARNAYTVAATRVGRTPRVRLGLARVAVRLHEQSLACDEYRWLLEWWGTRPDSPPEIAEARAYVASPDCTQ